MGSAGAAKLHPLSRPVKREALDELPASLALPTSAVAAAVDGREEDEALREAAALTRVEVIRRRLRRVQQLDRLYRRQYWSLTEDLRVRLRHYYWEYGMSPFEEDEEEEEEEANGAAAAPLGSDGSEDGWRAGPLVALGHGEAGDGGRKKGQRRKCLYAGCKSNAMPLTMFCHSHILSDNKQTLYKPCSYVIKSAHNGPIFCQKPVLRSAVPSLCPVHFQKAQKHVSQALKKAGLNVSSSSRPAPKFHVIVAEYVRQIQAKRKSSVKKITRGNSG